MRILFVDGVCPKPYTARTLNTEPMGGTEATVSRIVRELSKSNQVRLYGRGHTELQELLGVTYGPLDHSDDFDPSIVVTLRDGVIFRKNKETYPNAKHYLWLHDVVSGEYQTHLLQTLADCPTNILVVSQWHKNQVMTALGAEIIKGNIRITIMYNPVEQYCAPSKTEIDNRKLIFYSSPHKGLEQVLEIFEYLHHQDNTYKLFVCNPGYYKDHDTFPEGVTNLGPLCHAEAMSHVRTSLCVLYPQTVFEETFGLVYAEANAMGTPVIGHDIGSAREILDHPKQVIDCTNLEEIVKTVQDWGNGKRLKVTGNKLFELRNVVAEWKKLLMFTPEKR